MNELSKMLSYVARPVTNRIDEYRMNRRIRSMPADIKAVYERWLELDFSKDTDFRRIVHDVKHDKQLNDIFEEKSKILINSSGPSEGANIIYEPADGFYHYAWMIGERDRKKHLSTENLGKYFRTPNGLKQHLLFYLLFSGGVTQSMTYEPGLSFRPL